MNFKEYYNLQEKKEKRRLDPKCWKGYRKSGTKMKGGVRVNNCVKINEQTFYKMRIPVPEDLRYKFGPTLSVESYPGDTPESAMRRFIASKAAGAGMSNKIGLMVNYAKNHQPFIKPVVLKSEPRQLDLPLGS